MGPGSPGKSGTMALAGNRGTSFSGEDHDGSGGGDCRAWEGVMGGGCSILTPNGHQTREAADLERLSVDPALARFPKRAMPVCLAFPRGGWTQDAAGRREERARWLQEAPLHLLPSQLHYSGTIMAPGPGSSLPYPGLLPPPQAPGSTAQNKTPPGLLSS